MTDALLEEEVVVDVDLTLEPRCESRHHDTEPDFHDGPAECSTRSGRVVTRQASDAPSVFVLTRKWHLMVCQECGAREPFSAFRFIPL